MTHPWVEDPKYSSASAPLSSSASRYQTSSQLRSRQRNVFLLLAQREVSPRTKHQAKKLWVKPAKCEVDDVELRCEDTDAKQDLFSWAESHSLHHWSAKYCPLLPPPRSTIAAAFSPDGKTLASTHGDHTVKIIDCQTGKCLKVLSGHRRTPWVVRFHPLYSDILASGSLDHEVRLWDANTADCIGSWDFYRPIASIAFHARGELLAIASGHKLYIWNYNKRGEASAPTIILKTRRSLRAVHFHPHGAPYLLTAEVNNLDSADSALTLATSSGYSNCPSTVFFANINSSYCPQLESKLSSPCLLWPAYLKDDGSIRVLRSDWASDSANGQQRASSSAQNPLTLDVGNQQHDRFVTPMDVCPGEASGSNSLAADAVPAPVQSNPTFPGTNNFEILNARDNVQMSTSESSRLAIPATAGHSRLGAHGSLPMSSFTNSNGLDIQMFLRNAEAGHHHLNPFGDPPSWELPFFQGWLMAQSNSGFRSALLNNNILGDLPLGGASGTDNSTSELQHMRNLEHLAASPSMPTTIGSSRGASRRHTSRSHLMTSVGPGVGGSLVGTQNDESGAHAASLGLGSDLATSLLAAGAAELPCTVKLRIWPHDIKDPCAVLDPEECRLTVSHAVLCSEMGAHFSPCGRFLVACVACLLPQTEGDQGSQLPMQYDSTGAGTSPTRHPLPSHRVIYELRVYSLEEATFGRVLASRAIRAAHCLTSIQFSPTSEHILLAYGRRHNSLLRSIVMDGETAIPIYTILEVYRVSDMELVRVLPSAEDEVNVACFHPSAGGGLVYGTKEGKLRILQYHGAECASTGPNFFVEENMLEIQKYALEC